MKIHFFTLNDIEDYRKNYSNYAITHKLIKTSKAQSKEDFDQELFYNFITKTYNVPGGIFESRIWGDTGFPGLRLDFNFGLRLDIPEGNFRVKISDFDSDKVVFDKYISGGRLLSVEQYFIRWQVEVFLDEQKIFDHTLNLEGQPVAIMCKFNALGDTIAFLPYFREFQKYHRCKLMLCLPDFISEFAKQLYPDIEQIDEVNFNTYATYYPMMTVSPFPVVPVDVRHMSLNRVGGMLFGIDYIPPKAIFKPTSPPVTNEPYVCIGIQGSNVRKGWLYPNGWDIVVDYLKRRGYRVFCIDRYKTMTQHGYTISMPEGAEDFTGNRPILERANMLYHAKFFIGLSSGLAWIAEAVNCPVVMITGFTLDWHEFYTPYRVSNRHGCNGCLNDMRVDYFNPKIPCPYHNETPRELECQKNILPRKVIETIERLIADRSLTSPALR